jgi:phosphotransferase system enzyme I (PtsP)
MERDYLVLLRDAGESLARLGGGDIDAFLERLVDLVNAHIRTDVASIYLYDGHTRELVLRATRGLSQEAVGRVHLHLGEGLVGHVLKTLEPLCERAASQNPHFKYFPETHEEPFESFLAVPVHRGPERLGVLVAQRREQDYFGLKDVLALQVLASQLAGAIENSGRPRAARTTAPKGQAPAFVHGRAVSMGYAHGRTIPLSHVRTRLALTSQPFERRYTLDEFKAALKAAEEELADLEQRFESELPELAALVFTAHQMMLLDAQFTGAMMEHIQHGENPPEAIIAVAREWMENFATMPDAYLREKTADVADLAARLLNKLVETTETHHESASERIVVARELYPSDVLDLHAKGVQGIVLTHGGETSHVALLARSLGIPLVLANDPVLSDLAEGTAVLLDADIGNVYVNPSPEVVSRFTEREAARATAAIVQMRPATYTRDGVRVHLSANINLIGETRLARELHAEGIGLYRSEFPFLIRPTFPSEEEQVLVYARLVQEMPSGPITIRTLDIGGDKGFVWGAGEPEDNPQLGLRSIRYSLQYPEHFHHQLRAILRGGALARDLRIMFPMIGSLEEWRAARAAVDAAMASLIQDELAHCENPVLGMMVEVPSAAILIEEFAAEVDFFCIGTNDLVQYLLGVDRGNEHVASYYRPDHPAVLRTIRDVVAVARRFGRPISLCGEMAHELRFVPFLLGVGVRELSADPRYLPVLQQAIESIDSQEAEAIANQILACRTSGELEALLTTGQEAELVG